MPVTITMTDDARCVWVRGEGVVTDEEYLGAHAEFLRSREGRPPAKAVLSDWSAVREVRVSTEALRQQARGAVEHARRNPGRRWVASLAPRDVLFGMARMWEVFQEETGWEVRTFRDREAAIAWLYAGIGADCD